MVVARRAALALLLTGVACLAIPAAGWTAVTLQPGILIESKGAQCTASFLYDGAGEANSGEVLLGTAAHCLTKVGDPVSDEAGEDFGRVAFIGDQDDVTKDFAFIQVLPEYVSRVSPAVKGHPDLPRPGVATSDQTRPGDAVQISGYGLLFGLTPATEEDRTATLVEQDALSYRVFGPLMQGDSGGPLVHLPSGRALGIVSQLCVGTCIGVEGPTVEGILAGAQAAGFPVRLHAVGQTESATSASPAPAASRLLARRTTRVSGRRVRLSLVATPAAVSLHLAAPRAGRWRTMDRRQVRGFGLSDGFRGLRVRGGRRAGRATVSWSGSSGSVTRRSYRFTPKRIS